MKKLLLLIALVLARPAMLWGQSHEILRPTADADTTTADCGPVTHISGFTMPGSWDAAGLATSSSQSTNSTASASRYRARVFTPWAASAQSGYTSLTINVNSSSPGADSIGIGIGEAAVEYSTNGGASYSAMQIDGGLGWTQQTNTASIPSNTALGNIRVLVCTSGGTDGTGIGGDSVTVWDIWTDGTYTPAATAGQTPVAAPVIQPAIISVVFLCGRLWG